MKFRILKIEVHSLNRRCIERFVASMEESGFEIVKAEQSHLVTNVTLREWLSERSEEARSTVLASEEARSFEARSFAAQSSRSYDALVQDLGVAA